MSKEKEESGCLSGIIFLLAIGALIYWGIPKLKKIDFVQNIITSDKELILGKWKIVGGAVYSGGETKRIKIKASGDNGIFGTVENPKYFIFSDENEFVRTTTNGEKTYTSFEIKNNKIITEYQEMEIIKLSSKQLEFKEELLMKPLSGKENSLGKIYYTFKTIKVK